MGQLAPRHAQQTTHTGHKASMSSHPCKFSNRHALHACSIMARHEFLDNFWAALHRLLPSAQSAWAVRVEF